MSMHTRPTDFDHVTTWVFDLDNTLYPPHLRLFDQIEVRMTEWVMRALSIDREKANQLRQDYWDRYGTTLAGLMREHRIDPGDYLDYVHDIDFSILPADPDLARAIAALPGRRIIYTNACAPYAEKVLTARGLDGLFAAVYGVEHADFHPKPEARAFDRVFGRDGLDPTCAAMFEDDPRNLLAPHQMGLATVLVGPDPVAAAHIHHHTDNLAQFLRQIAN